MPIAHQIGSLGNKQGVTVGPEDKPLRVLIVDDEQVIADSLARILTQNGFAATPAYSGEEALELAGALDPDVVLSDVVMPGITGVELALQLTKRFPSCHIVLYSSMAVVTNLLKSPDASHYPFTLLAKPIYPDDLIAYLRTQLPA